MYKPAARGQAMHVRMQSLHLPPGVQRDDHAGLRSKVFPVTQKFEERIP
jgi:hypothetical protein